MGVKIDLIDGRNNYLAYSDSYALHSIDCFGHVFLRYVLKALAIIDYSILR